MPVLIKGKPRVDKNLSDDDVLWRYVDTAKFLDFVHNQRLFFPRSDQLPDKFEGAFTEAIKQKINSSYQANGIPFTYEEFKTRLRERVFLNCWHASKDDSMAMWSIYGRSTNSVAITTTVGRLRDSLSAAELPHFLSINKVKYVKHWRNPDLDTKPYSNVFSYKVKAYEFEKEVRIIVDRFSEEFDEPSVDVGMYVSIIPSNLVRSVVIAPEAPTWYSDLVKGIVDKYGVAVPVKQSKLTFSPV